MNDVLKSSEKEKLNQLSCTVCLNPILKGLGHTILGNFV